MQAQALLRPDTSLSHAYAWDWFKTLLSAPNQNLQVSFFAQWEMNNAVAPVMVQQRSGVIVNVGSVTSYCAVAQAAAYSASK
jgi:short-subunit dehydrogenase